MYSLSLAGHISRYYKLTATRFFISAAAKYGGGGVHKFRLARRRAEFFSDCGRSARFRLIHCNQSSSQLTLRAFVIFHAILDSLRNSLTIFIGKSLYTIHTF